MSTETGSADYSEKELRGRFPEVVQGRAEKAKVLHLPDPEGDGPEPLCDRSTSNGWRAVPIQSFPEGHRDFCHYCERRLREQERGGTPQGLTNPSRTVKMWETQYGNALKSDW